MASFELQLRATPEILAVVRAHEKELKGAVGAKTIIALGAAETSSRKFDAETETKLDEKPLRVAIRRV